MPSTPSGLRPMPRSNRILPRTAKSPDRWIISRWKLKVPCPSSAAKLCSINERREWVQSRRSSIAELSAGTRCQQPLGHDGWPSCEAVVNARCFVRSSARTGLRACVEPMSAALRFVEEDLTSQSGHDLRVVSRFASATTVTKVKMSNTSMYHSAHASPGQQLARASREPRKPLHGCTCGALRRGRPAAR
jgi:hypothetical protein